jgi:hemerythrin-like domain-containing protein
MLIKSATKKGKTGQETQAFYARNANFLIITSFFDVNQGRQPEGDASFRHMNKCIETMMEEHEVIVRVLASLQAMARKLESGDASRQDVADFGRFFKEFADRCHHGKEEERLFAKMIECGFPREMGPIAVMLSEHDAGRKEVRQLITIGMGEGPLAKHEKAIVIEAAAQFVPLLYGHILKENNILYPMAQQSIPAKEMGALDDSCAAFDREVVGAGAVKGLRQLAEDLVRRYPANPEELAIYGGCGGACRSVAA